MNMTTNTTPHDYDPSKTSTPQELAQAALDATRAEWVRKGLAANEAWAAQCRATQAPR